MRTVENEKDRLSDIVAIKGILHTTQYVKLFNSSLNSDMGNLRQQMPFEKEIRRLVMSPPKHAELM